MRASHTPYKRARGTPGWASGTQVSPHGPSAFGMWPVPPPKCPGVVLGAWQGHPEPSTGPGRQQRQPLSGSRGGVDAWDGLGGLLVLRGLLQKGLSPTSAQLRASPMLQRGSSSAGRYLERWCPGTSTPLGVPRAVGCRDRCPPSPLSPHQAVCVQLCDPAPCPPSGQIRSVSAILRQLRAWFQLLALAAASCAPPPVGTRRPFLMGLPRRVRGHLPAG